jgi:3-oxoacyl-[acyl-carrier protein] reductase
MNLGISGKTALITASSNGIGKSIAYTLAQEGVNVVLFARTKTKLENLTREIEAKYGVKAYAFNGDMLNENDISQLALFLKDTFNGPDILVLNTPRPPNPLRSTVEETQSERWHEAYHNQLWSSIQLSNHVLPLMLHKGWGRIIAITSASVKQPMPHHSLSTVFRAGMTAYIKHLANEVGVHGITANCVAPALIDNSHRQGSAAYTQEQTNARLKLTPLARMGTQEEIAGVVTFLTSMQAGFITGTSIVVDGGMSRALQ